MTLLGSCSAGRWRRVLWGRLATTTLRVVRYLETTQHVRVLDISLDYAVDDGLKAWLLWGTKVTGYPRGVACRQATFPLLAIHMKPTADFLE